MAPRLLVVDDELDVPDLFRQRFRREIKAGTVKLVFAANGVEALEKLRACTGFDVVLSDINMPELGGLELLEEIRREWPELPVVLVSAYSGQTNREKAISHGAREFVSKPVDFQRLRSIVAEIGGRPA
ncbi:MAG: response regulator [Minwuia sp.]|uniref:response regulator n=1 Tax=Minwuia sp. TaxID=2493630 RepID=UPI003A88A2FC